MLTLSKWFWVALLVVLTAAPNATIIRVAVADADPIYWTFTRSLIIAVLCMPFIIRGFGALRSAVARKNLLIASISLTVSVISVTFAIYYSQASYASILSLMTPIMFVILSAKLVGDKITRRSIAGVVLAAIGAMVLVVLPIALHNPGVAFYPLATVLGVVNSIGYALGIIHLRKANEAGVQMPVSIGLSALMTTVVTFFAFVVFGDWTRTPVDGGFWLAVSYSAIVIALIGRAMNVAAYEHIGAATISALGYVQTLIAILIPVAILNEQLSVEMVVGGIVILIGVYMVEHHKHPHNKVYFLHRDHGA